MYVAELDVSFSLIDVQYVFLELENSEQFFLDFVESAFQLSSEWSVPINSLQHVMDRQAVAVITR